MSGTRRKLAGMRGMLHRDAVRHQEAQMKVKQGIVEIQGGLAETEEGFDASLGRVQDIQEIIFKSLPFELI